MQFRFFDYRSCFLRFLFKQLHLPFISVDTIRFSIKDDALQTVIQLNFNFLKVVVVSLQLLSIEVRISKLIRCG